MIKMHKIIRIIIVNYKKDDEVLTLIDSINQQILKEYIIEIVIIDNSKNLKFKNNFNNINPLVVVPSKNLGYSVACNMGAKIKISNYKPNILAFLSPDIQLKEKLILQKIIKKIKKTNSKYVYSPCQLNPCNTFEKVGRNFPTIFDILIKRFKLKWLRIKTDYLSINNDYDVKGNLLHVDWLQSSSIFIPSKIFYLIGGFDESFFVFCADLWLGFLLKEKKIKSVLIKNIIVNADGKRASESKDNKSFFINKILLIHIFDYLKYILKRFLYRKFYLRKSVI